MRAKTTNERIVPGSFSVIGVNGTRNVLRFQACAKNYAGSETFVSRTSIFSRMSLERRSGTSCQSALGPRPTETSSDI